MQDPVQQNARVFFSKTQESLDQIHDRLQKLVSQLKIHRVSLSQEDVNLKFLRSLPSEWKTHTLIWRNKADLEKQSLDDLFNSLKIYEAKVKHSFSTGTTTQNLAFVSSSNIDSTTEWSVITATGRDILQGNVEEEPANYALMAFSSSSSSSDNEVSDSENESETKAPQIVPSFVQSTEQVKSPRPSIQHAETSIPADTPKPANYDYHEKKMAQPTSRNHAHRGNQKHYAQMTHQNPQKHMVPTAVLPQFKAVSITAVRSISTVVPKIKVTNPKQVQPIVTKPKSPIRRHITRSPSLKTSNSPPRITAVKALVMCDKKNSVLFTDTKCLVLSSDFKLPDESHVHLGVFLATKDATSPILKTFITGLENQLSLSVKVIRSDNGTEFINIDLNQFCGMNGIKREFSVTRTPQQMALLKEKTGKFEGTVDERFLVGYSVVVLLGCLILIVSHRLRIVNQSLQEIDQQYLLFPMWSSSFTNPQNNDGDAAFDGKEPDFDAKKPESEVIVSLSSSPQSKKQDDKTKKEAKGKSLVESFTGYKDLSAEFKDYSNNIINEVNVAGTLVPTVGQISPNNTNTFSVAGNNFSAAEADFNNLETSIIVTPNPTTRVHKDHHVTQIIGDLSLATQTRSMARVAKDLGGLSQMFNDDFHTYMFACFLSQEEPKRKVWILVDFPYGKRAIGTKWVFENKKDERGIVVRNKARLIAQGHTQEEEEVYVCQPLGFEDPDHPDKVYKVVKALYGLHQALRDWYETLANYLLENDF
nr:hypothetical protein [Tanacetum cinerariifolium]